MTSEKGKWRDPKRDHMKVAWNLQRSPLFCAPGLVKFVTAVATLFCLALPGSFLNVFAQNKGDLCIAQFQQ